MFISRMPSSAKPRTTSKVLIRSPPRTGPTVRLAGTMPLRVASDMRCAALVLAAISMASAQKLPFDIQALMKVVRIGEPHLSPDGRLVAYTARTVDIDQ